MDKILVTGAGGFIGSHLAELLVQEGARVKALVHYNSKNQWGWIEESEYRAQIEVVLGDIRDYDSVYNAIKGCEFVYHLAALIGIPYSYVSPLAYIKTNIQGTYNVLEASRQLGIENVLITSTSETYGTAQYVPIDEKHPAVGQSPYSASKIAADQLCVSYYRSFGLPVKIVRPFNTYGPRQSARAIIPTVISQALSGCKTIKVGNVHPTRDLTFVRDTVNGFFKIAKSPSTVGEAINIGMGTEISVGDLIRKLLEILGKDVQIVQADQRIRPENSEVERLVCDNTKLREQTGWVPNYTLEKGLTETIEWISSHLHLYKPTLYNV